MTRSKKLLYNTVSSLAYQLITLVCGFILPRFFLSYYGSAVNGLVSSISQFLGFITLAECGVGAVVQSTLYKPLADKNDLEISRIYVSSERFFRKIAYILLVYVVALMIVYPLITLDSFGYIYTMLLILVISISSFAQYYFGMTYRLLLNADQLGFIQYTIHSLILILNTICCVVLMRFNAPIHVVKLVTSLIFIMQPALMAIIARRKYKIDRKVELNGEPIKQKWNGLAQHIAAVVLGNTDTVVLTILSTLENVSIYAVYHLVVNGVKQIVVSLTNGMQAMLGNMMAKKEDKQLIRTFETFEWLMHTLVTVVFTITAVTIVPFVSVYTKGITDTNYIVPAFAYLITLAQASYCLRLPYNIAVLAAGQYKQTQWSAIIEAAINIIVSVVLVFRFGLIGVAVGTLVAMTYRTCYFVHYLSKNILYRKPQYFLKHIAVDGLCVAAVIGVTELFSQMFILAEITYISWFILAIKVGITVVVISGVINIIFYKNKFVALVSATSERIKKDMKKFGGGGALPFC